MGRLMYDTQANSKSSVQVENHLLKGPTNTGRVETAKPRKGVWSSWQKACKQEETEKKSHRDLRANPYKRKPPLKGPSATTDDLG